MRLFGSKKKVEKKEENLSSIKEGVIGSSSGLSTPTNPPSPPSPPIPQNAPSSLGSSSSVSSSQNLSNSVSNSNLGATDVNSSLSSSQDIPKPDSSGLENFDVPSLSVKGEDTNDENLFNLDDLDLGLENFTDEIGNSKSTKNVVDTQFEENSYVKHKVDYDKPIFITTEQFKNVLEHIDFIKSKVKEASDTYLRLMDIKAEEDIEYENMRKDFQTIEEKLYEVDNILFEG